MKKVHWNRLLNEIKDQRVVPVIGKEFLEVDFNNTKVSFYDKVTLELAEELEVEPDASKSGALKLNDVAFAFLDQGGDLLDVSYQIAEIVRNLSESIPDSLRKLAEIRHFDLFISTTPDSLLKFAIDSVRFDGDDTTIELAYSPTTELADLPDNYAPGQHTDPIVYQLFGNVSFAPDFVVTDDDLLKYVSALQSHDHRPDNLLDALHSRSLAWMGTSYPDWLIRFLLCSAKAESLFVTKAVRGYVADQQISQDHSLRRFFNRHRAVIYDSGDAVSFIDELHGRWKERFGNSKNDETAALSTEGEVEPFPRNGVFVSYASEDLAAARTLREAISEFGIKVWMDKHDLAGGDRWEQTIRENIESCSLFLPLISRNTETPERRYFRMEWNHAIREEEVRPPTYPFIQPIVIDDTDFASEYLPREFRQRHAKRFPAGRPDSDFLERVKLLIRDLSRQQRRAL